MFIRYAFVRQAAPVALSLSLLLAVPASVALAHAQYSSSTPAANAAVSAVPSTLQITYTQELSDEQIAVLGPDGSNVTTAPATFDLENRHNASVPLRDAGPGTYTVIWHNVSGDDGDPNDGTFVFTEVAPAPVQNAAPTTNNTTATPPSPATAPVPVAGTTTQTQTTASPTCIDNGVKTPGIADVRADTYCKRQVIRDLFKGKIDNSGLDYSLSIGEGLESALSDACIVAQDQCVLPKGFGLTH